ncbi:heme-dependent oxidative N-demethylase family protein [Yoonia litorea]|uniref:DUF3445 domain-containing protein n=1 Tax=Yoonia litorea TaxID=1123755 RepID=A0A1I6MZK6_9RHOB|nr:DUF3445 domain-containing protein [Yoonia litorea]SFS21041.1 Protein of unknown function [Yoonia litorea]
MPTILQSALPDALTGDAALPGTRPCPPDGWLMVDDAYADQMAYRADLLRNKRDAVLYAPDEVLGPARELLDEVLACLPAKGFSVSAAEVTCPDGRTLVIDRDAPLLTLGHLVQEDLCILEKRGAEHVLTGAVLCFPASWRLADKVGRPLATIHDPVPEYDSNIAARVQRLFDGVQVGRPLWRFNRLRYANPDLHQPVRQDPDAPRPYHRSERQSILRLPRTQAVVFTIHTFVVADR